MPESTKTAEKPATLMQALLAVQAEAPTLPKDATNPHFKSAYTPLDTIVEKIGPLLTKHGLVWMTLPVRDEHGDPALTYRLIHAATNEQVEGTMPLMLTKADSQGQGSAITYARRYSMTAVLNLVADDDDDGNAAGKTNGQAAPPAPAEHDKSLEAVTLDAENEQLCQNLALRPEKSLELLNNARTLEEKRGLHDRLLSIQAQRQATEAAA